MMRTAILSMFLLKNLPTDEFGPFAVLLEPVAAVSSS